MKELKCQHPDHNRSCYGENIYMKVGNEKRLALLNMVKLQGRSLKDAAAFLDINYSTAKTILRVFRIENRILKKTPHQKRSKKFLFSVEKNSEEDSSIAEVPSKPNEQNASKSEITPPKIHIPAEQALEKKKREEMMAQYQVLCKTLQFCVNEVVSNEMVIKNVCANLQSLNFPNFIEKFKKSFAMKNFLRKRAEQMQQNNSSPHFAKGTNETSTPEFTYKSPITNKNGFPKLHNTTNLSPISLAKNSICTGTHTAVNTGLNTHLSPTHSLFTSGVNAPPIESKLLLKSSVISDCSNTSPEPNDSAQPNIPVNTFTLDGDGVIRPIPLNFKDLLTLKK